MVINRVKMLVKWWFKGGSCPPLFVVVVLPVIPVIHLAV